MPKGATPASHYVGGGIYSQRAAFAHNCLKGFAIYARRASPKGFQRKKPTNIMRLRAPLTFMSIYYVHYISAKRPPKGRKAQRASLRLSRFAFSPSPLGFQRKKPTTQSGTQYMPKGPLAGENKVGHSEPFGHILSGVLLRSPKGRKKGGHILRPSLSLPTLFSLRPQRQRGPFGTLYYVPFCRRLCRTEGERSKTPLWGRPFGHI